MNALMKGRKVATNAINDRGVDRFQDLAVGFHSSRLDMPRFRVQIML